jgi:FKBP-type peptidyl-prolyl cis-trans isomerase
VKRGVGAAALCLAMACAHAQDAAALKNEQEQRSYALGMNHAMSLRKHAIAVDSELFSRGLKDALRGGSTLLTEEQMRTIVAAVQGELREKQVAHQAEAALGLAEKNKNEGEDFLAKNKANDGVVALKSGLQYKILTSGKGAKPTIDDTVVIHYRGMLLDGREFGSSYRAQTPASLPLKSVIEGWKQALPLMPAGSKWRLFVPPKLAYGDRGVGRRVGPNSTLIFDVELFDVVRQSAKSKR